MKYVWLVNTPNPQSPVSEISSDLSNHGLEQDNDLWQEWLSGKVIGEPKATDGLSVEQLKAQGYVGIYKYI